MSKSVEVGAALDNILHPRGALNGLCGLTLLFVASLAHADDTYFSSSSQLLEMCSVAIAEMDGQKTNREFDATVCVSYLAGYRDGFAVANEGGKNICIPSSVTAGQLARVFAKWGREHPELLHENKAVGVTRALVSAFPCEVGR